MPPITHSIALPGTLGPLRSVQRSGVEGRLLIGARLGVLDIALTLPSPGVPGEGEEAKEIAYTDSSVVSQLGFNQAVIWNNEIWASHSEAEIGVVKRGQGDWPFRALLTGWLIGGGG